MRLALVFLPALALPVVLGGVVPGASAQVVENGRIAFQSNRGPQPFCCRIVTMNADGSDIRRLLRNFEDSWDPAWSPDGSRIAFASLRGHFDLFTAGADGRNVQRLTKDQKTRDSSAAWSPTGDELAFVSTIDGSFDIFRMDADGTNVVNLTQSPDANDCGCFEPFFVFAQPAFSHDGGEIAFSSDLADPVASSTSTSWTATAATSSGSRPIPRSTPRPTGRRTAPVSLSRAIETARWRSIGWAPTEP